MTYTKKELNDEHLNIVTGGNTGETISYDTYSVIDNGVYVDGDNYYFVCGRYEGIEMYVNILRRFLISGNQFSSNSNPDFKSIQDLCGLTYLGTTDENNFTSASSPAELKLNK